LVSAKKTLAENEKLSEQTRVLPVPEEIIPEEKELISKQHDI